MRDCRVSEQAADARLRQSRKIAGDHRCCGNGEEYSFQADPNGIVPMQLRNKIAGRHVVGPAEEPIDRQQATDGEQQREACHLGHRSNERGSWRGRPLVCIRSPKVERDRSDLKSQTGYNENPSDVEQRGWSLSEDRILNVGNIGTASQSVDVAETEEQERSRHAAKKVIFQRGFSAFAGGLGKCGHDVEPKAQKLQTYENDQQILRCGNNQAASGRHEHNRDKLAHMARKH